jgi:hypothetical protein
MENIFARNALEFLYQYIMDEMSGKCFIEEKVTML